MISYNLPYPFRLWGSVLLFILSGWACRFDASSIGRVISVERVRYGNLFFSTVFNAWHYESYDYVA